MCHMKRKFQQYFWRCALVVFLALRVFAQITLDGSLPNNSNATRNGNIFNITGGTQAGSNLFDSFRDFSIPNNGTALDTFFFM